MIKRQLIQVDVGLLLFAIFSLRASASAQSLGKVLAAQKNAIMEII
jgi:hypothetical protein